MGGPDPIISYAYLDLKRIYDSILDIGDDKVSTCSCNFCLQVVASATEYENARRRRIFWKIGSSCTGLASNNRNNKSIQAYMSIKMPAAGEFFEK